MAKRPPFSSQLLEKLCHIYTKGWKSERNTKQKEEKCTEFQRGAQRGQTHRPPDRYAFMCRDTVIYSTLLNVSVGKVFNLESQYLTVSWASTKVTQELENFQLKLN